MWLYCEIAPHGIEQYEGKRWRLNTNHFHVELFHDMAGNVIFIGYCINTTFYDRGHVSDALPSLRGNALPRHERGHKMLHLYNNIIIIYPYQINRNHADT